MAKIFVQIAAYRDPELPFTIADLFSKAKYSDEIRVGICNQGTPSDWRHEILADDRVRQVKVPFHESMGTCWARSQVQKLYEGEEFTLQLDSHHRFVQDWDSILTESLQKIDCAKPLFTAYLPHYEGYGEETVAAQSGPGKQVFSKFDEDGIVHFLASGFEPGEGIFPVKARFTSGHFIFGPGKFVEEVPYDPVIYFTGEEITMAVRAYTHGYDLFHPTKAVAYHKYGRAADRRHWDDHSPAERPNAESHWADYQAKSVGRIHAVLENSPSVPGPFRLGTTRSLEDYERYAGIRFRRRLVHQNTVFGLEPPATRCWNWDEADRPCSERSGKLQMNTEEIAADDDVDFWYLGLHDANGLELLRLDLTDPQYTKGRRTDVQVHFWSHQPPQTYTLIPHRTSGEWGDRLVGTITERNFEGILVS